MADAPAGLDDGYLPINAAEWRPELADDALAALRRNLSRYYSSVAGWPGQARQAYPLFDPPASEPDAYVVDGTTASSPQNAIQTIDAAGAYPTSDQWSVTYNGHSSGLIAFGANQATVQAAFEGITGIGPGNVSVTGSPSHPTSPAHPMSWAVEFVGALAAQAVSAFIPSTTSAGDTITVTQTQAGHP